MRAVRLEGPRSLAVVDVADPVAGPGEALVRVAACGICGSDLSCYKAGVFAGGILGHELSGMVEGTDERVVVDPKLPCGACEDCLAGAPNRCIQALTRGVGQSERGGFASHVAVPRASLHPVPDGLDLTVASLAEPLAVVLRGLGRVSWSGGPAVVLGLGPIGLLSVAALRARGATAVVASDPVGRRRDLALQMGADDAVEPGDPLVRAAGASLVVETSGHPSALPEAGNVVRAGGTVLLLGIPFAESTVQSLVWVSQELTLVGSVAQSAADFTDAIAMLAAEPSIGGMITDRIGLDEVPGAFERLISEPDAGKITVVPDGGR